MSYKDPREKPHLARLIHDARDAMTPARLDYLQRQAVVTARPIQMGEEVLVRYHRRPW